MRRRQRKQAIAVILASIWLGLAACDTGAIGVESCRDIEYARCSAAAHCPSMFALKSQAACRRFYRDHCLHGLPLSQDPGAGQVVPCVNAIKAIGDCADKQTEAVLVGDCKDPDIPGYDSEITACELLRSPENITQCSFLNPATATGGAGGATSTGGTTSTGGESATGG